MKNIVVIGGGFAGLWAAIGAARKLDELNIGTDRVQVSLINRDAWHGVRVRNYEADLSVIRVPLDSVLPPVGVRLIEGEVTGIDCNAEQVAIKTPDGGRDVAFDRLILAAGSRVSLPALPGLADYGFNVDTYNAAERLDRHLKVLSQQPLSAGRDTVLVVGGGLTGIEIACEMPDRLKAVGIASGRVILADRQPHIGSDMGAEARPVIDSALDDLGVETQTGIDVAEIDDRGVTLADGERIAAHTVIWCAGMAASPLSACLPGDRDRMGRVSVDTFMKVRGLDHVYAAGDIAAADIDDGHLSVMSCQHARPMGRFAGHNAVADLFGEEPLSLKIPWYLTCLDLGPAGAVLTEGWERAVTKTGADAKKTKQTINCVRIYPPASQERDEILAAAAPAVQAPPARPDTD